ncbi:MAG TPA: hypothetical protein VGE52_14830, partial [Pirellulales bacterium]
MGFSKIDKVLCVAPLSAEWSAVSTKVSSVTAGQTLQKLDKAKTMFEGAKASAKVDVGTSKVKVGLAKKKVVFRIELAKGFYGKEDVTLVAKWTDQSALAKAYNDVKLHVDTSIMERLNSITTDVAEIMKMDDPVKAIAEFNRVQQRADKLTPICSQADIKKQASEAAKNR